MRQLKNSPDTRHTRAGKAGKRTEAFDYHGRVPRRAVCIAAICLCTSLALPAQSGRHGGSHSASQGSSTTPADNPDLANFNRAVAVEATGEQKADFKLLVKYTEAARQQAQSLQKAAPDGAVRQAAALQDSLDEVQRQQRDFLRTFSDAQAAGLKKPARKLTQSGAGLEKEARKFSAQLDQIPPDPRHLQQTAVRLDKALAALRSDQNALATEMAIDAH